jgi:diaminopimelate epimerase
MRLTKHHGLGNDFLVLLDLDGATPVTPADAVALCDRRTGVGADGLLRVTPGVDGADVAMQLLNADGSPAEMSGNGIRGLAQAVFQAGVASPPDLLVATDAGPRRVRVLDGDIHGPTQRMSVEMGTAKVLGAEPDWVGGLVEAATRVDLGNPHVVLRWSGDELPDRAALIALAEPIDAAIAGGANVEVVRAGDDGGLEMVVFERGVGPTQACGTGACAALAAAYEWGLTGRSAEVRMPGGPVEVELGETVVLTGDITSVAAIEVPWP